MGLFGGRPPARPRRKSRQGDCPTSNCAWYISLGAGSQDHSTADVDERLGHLRMQGRMNGGTLHRRCLGRARLKTWTEDLASMASSDIRRDRARKGGRLSAQQIGRFAESPRYRSTWKSGRCDLSCTQILHRPFTDILQIRFSLRLRDQRAEICLHHS